MKSLGPRMLAYTSNPRKLRQADLRVQGQPLRKHLNQGHTFCLPLGLHEILEEGRLNFFCLLAQTNQHIYWNPLLQEAYTEDQAKQPPHET